MIRLLLAATAALAICGPAAAADAAKVKRGEYLVTIMACSDCHTPGVFLGKPDFSKTLAGSDVGFAIPGLGYFWAPNLTPDDETGLGKWSEDDIVKTLRTGTRPDGRQLIPSMPWMAYGVLTDDDAYAIAAYLKSLAPISNEAEVAPVGWGETPKAPYQTVVMPETAAK
ncbi:Alcohol dehydrogenase (quinone), cytochrome c subunit [Alphaproteobacteria bacterium SO-S41]|nr:Alcohol dehydrogenase (quinone), cytochrome c subunit [Alphaproteobacteria bacterium SO-S41]